MSIAYLLTSPSRAKVGDATQMKEGRPFVLFLEDNCREIVADVTEHEGLQSSRAPWTPTIYCHVGMLTDTIYSKYIGSSTGAVFR
jgi:hypothetical protein